MSGLKKKPTYTHLVQCVCVCVYPPNLSLFILKFPTEVQHFLVDLQHWSSNGKFMSWGKETRKEACYLSVWSSVLKRTLNFSEKIWTSEADLCSNVSDPLELSWSSPNYFRFSGRKLSFSVHWHQSIASVCMMLFALREGQRNPLEGLQCSCRHVGKCLEEMSWLSSQYKY